MLVIFVLKFIKTRYNILLVENLKEKLNKVDQLKRKLDGLRPLNPDVENGLKNWVHNAIIANSTREKIYDSIRKNYYDSEDRKLLEKSHEEALNYINELTTKKINELNKIDILNIHFILLKKVHPDFAGKYRDSNATSWVSLGNKEQDKVCHYSLIQDKMDNYFSWLFSKNNEHPLIIVAEAHNKFVDIHPFVDGNGRTARLIMNLILMQNGFLPIFIRTLKKEEKYNNPIKLWRKGTKNDFYFLIANLEEESLKMYLEKIT